MDYAVAAATAPPGWRHFKPSDFERLPDAVKRHELARVPPSEARLIAEGDRSAVERFVRAEFWTLVYHLLPERWDRLSLAEPVSSEMVAALPRVERAVEVAAGSGRLTIHLAGRAERLVAVEPSLGLIRLLRPKVPAHVQAVAGWAESLPIRSGWAQLTTACGALGPDPVVLAELDRVTSAGGLIALINPEEPSWFAANGWHRRDFEPGAVEPHEGWLDAFFGPPELPRVLLTRTV